MAGKKTNTALLIGGGIILLLLSGKKGSGSIGSKYYNVSDVQRSDTATREGIKEQFKQLSPTIIKNASFIAENFLDPLSDLMGGKLDVDSWWRSTKLNKAVGGVPGSNHLRALAVDIDHIEGGRNRNDKLLKTILLTSEIPYTRLIVYGDPGHPSELHVFIDPADPNKHEILRKTDSGDYRSITKDLLLMGLRDVEI